MRIGVECGARWYHPWYWRRRPAVFAKFPGGFKVGPIMILLRGKW